ncbi:hypothetical protein HU200_004997 [Digitaria exilis]|uniref:Uncharacterized protein n=1 Tax=Digitaria exilis TaxID=1010633 RepID=A0A835KSX8_9POAL|nr:hypothetical protein HU200_004997 [Digitaria exilis]
MPAFCVFTKQIWHNVSLLTSLPALAAPVSSLLEWWLHARRGQPKSKRKGVDSRDHDGVLANLEDQKRVQFQEWGAQSERSDEQSTRRRQIMGSSWRSAPPRGWVAWDPNDELLFSFPVVEFFFPA